jgi:antirestriction protein ArdC
MATKNRKPIGEKADPYELITEQIIAQLERGVAPWHKPWQSTGGLRPRNMDTNKNYQGANLFLLGLSAMEQGYTSPFWGTYKQIEALGGNVRKGEHGTAIRKWVVVEDDEPRKAGEEPKRRGFVKFYTVFSYHQTDGLLKERFEIRPQEPLPEPERIARAEEIIANYLTNGGPSLRHGLDRAYYSPKLDMISVPVIVDFETLGDYYATVFHEIAHSTGHPKRLNRHGIEGGHQFGSERYSKEELVAEMGAAFATSILDIEPVANLEHSAEYLNSWIGRLRNDKTLIFEAAAAAQKAVEHVGLSLEQEVVLAHDQEITPKAELEHIELIEPVMEQLRGTAQDAAEIAPPEPAKSLEALRKAVAKCRNDLAISSARKDNPDDLARLDLDTELHRLTWRRFGAVHAGVPVDEIDEKIIATNANYQVITGKVPDPIRRTELIEESQSRHAGDAEKVAEAKGALANYREELRQSLSEQDDAWIEKLGPLQSEDDLLEVVEFRRNFDIFDPERPYGDLEAETPEQVLQRIRSEKQIAATRVEVGPYQSR